MIFIWISSDVRYLQVWIHVLKQDKTTSKLEHLPMLINVHDGSRDLNMFNIFGAGITWSHRFEILRGRRGEPPATWTGTRLGPGLQRVGPSVVTCFIHAPHDGQRISGAHLRPQQTCQEC